MRQEYAARAMKRKAIRESIPKARTLGKPMAQPRATAAHVATMDHRR
jgi:hypothetical protein